ncbi:hypothetical protein ILUMI_02013 [Ignelater luminosus]|uniref:Uncharacterized protein n=1 Tax=Ignelater luminosus TaxID=2038154 RepID=A0A8K0DDC4_IGNLU|nr:hypothetical protein ILUMI_02013 [Ignelater luminosus]
MLRTTQKESRDKEGKIDALTELVRGFMMDVKESKQDQKAYQQESRELRRENKVLREENIRIKEDMKDIEKKQIKSNIVISEIKMKTDNQMDLKIGMENFI